MTCKADKIVDLLVQRGESEIQNLRHDQYNGHDQEEVSTKRLEYLVLAIH
jgi:hypothetical protein